MPKQLDVREGDTLTIKARVMRVSDDGAQVTIEVWGQRITQPIDLLHLSPRSGQRPTALGWPVEQHEKGHNWPENA